MSTSQAEIHKKQIDISIENEKAELQRLYQEKLINIENKKKITL